MNNNLQDLTKKIYHEGIEKANDKGEEIIQEAKQKAQNIIAQAEQKANDIIQGAEKKAADSKLQHEAEMRLASRQAMAALKQKITDLIIWEVMSAPIENAFKDEVFIQELIQKLIDYWTSNFGDEDRLDILLPEEDFKEVQKNMRAKSQELLQKGVNVQFSGSMKNGFQISPEDGRFKVRFTDEDFENYFKNFARPRTFKLLFGEQS